MRSSLALVGLWLGATTMLISGQQGTQAVPEQSGNAVRGKLVFEHRCAGCHALNVDREGPRLHGVYGRKAGSVAGFQYSESLRDSGLMWTPVALNQWLTDPDAMVPGNNMGFATPKAQDRKDLIAFLQQADAR